MKKETMINIISEEFNNQDFSWLLDVIIKAVKKTDSKYQKVTEGYEKQYSYVRNQLEQTKITVSEMESEEKKDRVRITHDRKAVKDNGE